MSKEKPDCFGREYNPRCNDCTVGTECEEYYRKQEQKPKEENMDLTKKFVEDVRVIRETELEAEEAAVEIFKDSMRHPFQLLSDNLRALYPDRFVDNLASVHSMAKRALDEILEDEN